MFHSAQVFSDAVMEKFPTILLEWADKLSTFQKDLVGTLQKELAAKGNELALCESREKAERDMRAQEKIVYEKTLSDQARIAALEQEHAKSLVSARGLGICCLLALASEKLAHSLCTCWPVGLREYHLIARVYGSIAQLAAKNEELDRLSKKQDMLIAAFEAEVSKYDERLGELTRQLAATRSAHENLSTQKFGQLEKAAGLAEELAASNARVAQLEMEVSRFRSKESQVCAVTTLFHVFVLLTG